MQRYILFLDLKNDPELIQTYEKYHESIPEAIKESILSSGIESMQIFRFENRLCMEILANDEFSLAIKEEMDANNPVVQEWENYVWKYQQALPTAKEGEKWILMAKIFDLKAK